MASLFNFSVEKFGIFAMMLIAEIDENLPLFPPAHQSKDPWLARFQHRVCA